MNPDPALSVVIVTPDTYETIRLTIRHIRAQTVRRQIEIVIVGPSAIDIAALEEDLADLWGHQVVAIGAIKSIGSANAAGVRRARAPLVALAEDHCFPEPGWAEALIAAHCGPWAAVGPVMQNGNPQTTISCSDFVMGYGPWMEPTPAGTVPFLPGHNSCYKKALLLEYGDRLDEMMEAETHLHIDLAQRGYQLYLEPNARVRHTNFGLASAWFPAQFSYGRLFAASRAANWGLMQKILYFSGSPLIPIVRLWRCCGELTKPGRSQQLLPRVLPVLLAGLAVDGFGQMVGYLFGAGNATEAVSNFEFHRFRHVSDTERRAAEKTLAYSFDYPASSGNQGH